MILKKNQIFCNICIDNYLSNDTIYCGTQYIVLFYLKNYTMLILLLSGHAMKLSWGKTA